MRSIRRCWCRRRDSNSHGVTRHPLKMVCLPIPPLRHHSSNNIITFSSLKYESSIKGYPLVPVLLVRMEIQFVLQQHSLLPQKMTILARKGEGSLVAIAWVALV